jgi:high-affinity iron transporter
LVSSLLLSLREGLEAALVIGIVLAVLKKIDRRDLVPAVWSGALAAVLLSLAVAFVLIQLSISFEGKAEQIFEGLAMLSAAALLTWMILWMRKHGSSLQTELEVRTTGALGIRDPLAIFFLVFFSVFREGLELALFLLAARLAAGGENQSAGVLIGLGLSAGAGWLLFAVSKKLNLRRFFQFTNVLLILFAAGLVGLAVHEFNEAGWIPALVEHVWDLSPILSEESSQGGILKALFGYQSSPSLTSILGYLGFLLVMVWKFGWIKMKNQSSD